MDPLTNSLAAFALSRTGLGRLTRHGEFVIILSANLPDLDVLAVPGSWTNLLSFVGGPLHSIAAAPVLAGLAATTLWLFCRRKADLLKVWLLALAGVVLRLALDLTSVSGIQLLYPLDRTWFHLDLLPWFDPWLFLLLLCFAFWPWLSYLVNFEMGIREIAGRGVAFATLLLAFAYTGYRASNHAEALSIVQRHNFGAEAPLHEICFPDSYSLVRVHCVIETESYFANIDYFTNRDFDAGAAQLLRRQQPTIWSAAQLESSWYRQIADRLRAPYWTVFPADFPAGATEMVMRDLVLAPEPHSRFRLRLLMDAQERLREESLVVDLQEFGRFESTRRP